MNNRPDESILISWLYGQLDEVEKAKVEKYFQENPDELRKMQQFRGVSDIMSNIRDKEVIAPPVFMNDDVKVVPFWKSNSFRTVMSIAASFVVIIVAARLLNMEVNYSDHELRISFGKRIEPVSNPSLTALEVQKMIDQSVAQNQAELDSKIQAVMVNNTAMEKVAKQLSTASNNEIRSFVATLQKDYLTEVRDYMQLSSSDQRKYTDNLVIEFSKYLQEQRTQDLNMFQTRFSRLEQNTDQLKSETEQILASIVSNSPQQVQQSSY